MAVTWITQQTSRKDAQRVLRRMPWSLEAVLLRSMTNQCPRAQALMRGVPPQQFVHIPLILQKPRALLDATFYSSWMGSAVVVTVLRLVWLDLQVAPADVECTQALRFLLQEVTVRKTVLRCATVGAVVHKLHEMAVEGGGVADALVSAVSRGRGPATATMLLPVQSRLAHKMRPRGIDGEVTGAQVASHLAPSRMLWHWPHRSALWLMCCLR